MKYHVGLLSFTPTRQLRMNYSSRRIAHWPILTTLKPLGCCEEQPSPSTKGYILVCSVPLLRQKQNGYLKTNSFPFLSYLLFSYSPFIISGKLVHFCHLPCRYYIPPTIVEIVLHKPTGRARETVCC